MQIFLSLAFLIMVSILACEKPVQKQVEQPKNNQQQGALTTANNKIQELSAQIEQLKTEILRLKTKNDFLTSQNAIIQPRIQQLIACYGTGIWDYSDAINFPVFVKSMKGSGVQDIIAELNERFKKYKQPQIIIKKKEGRTVFIGIDNEDQLGEQMGSNGALSYMTAVTYSLVSVKGIECVYFDIGESEHAGPGKYCNDSLEPLTPK